MADSTASNLKTGEQKIKALTFLFRNHSDFKKLPKNTSK
jgi:hypothetical protein